MSGGGKDQKSLGMDMNRESKMGISKVYWFDMKIVTKQGMKRVIQIT